MVEDKAIHEWLVSAGTDANAAQILYKSGTYPQALFCLQQAVEKMNKAVGLWAQFLQRKDFQKVSHNHDRLHDMALDQQEKTVEMFQEMNVDFIGLYSETLTGQRVEMDEYTEEFTKLKNIRKTAELSNVRDFDFEQLEYHLAELESVPHEIRTEIDNADISGSWNPLLSAMVQNIPSDENEVIDPAEREKMIAFVADHTSGHIQAFYKVFPYFLQVHLLGFFTSPFAYTRYPDEEKGFNPATAYTIVHPFVRLFPRFHAITAQNIRRLTLLARIARPFSFPDFEEED